MTNIVPAPLTLTPINGEPRIRDLDLAERLGFSEPRMIRKLIKSNEAKLLMFGVCDAVERTSGAQGGRPASEFYLNQKQAIFICMKSETANAFDVQVEIVHVFDAHLNGSALALPKDYPAALRALADESERRMQMERELEASRPKLDFYDQVVNTEILLDFPQVFSLMQQRTGQNFTRRTFLEFLRRHGVACQANRHANIGPDRFVPRKDYTGTWFVSQLSPSGVVEWFMRPLALDGVIRLIEYDRTAPVLSDGRVLAVGTGRMQ